MEFGIFVITIFALMSEQTVMASNMSCNGTQTPAVRVCNDDSISNETAMYLDTAGLHVSEISTCMCTLYIPGTDGMAKNIGVRPILQDPGSFSMMVNQIFINTNQSNYVNVTSATASINFTRNIPALQTKQCFELKEDPILHNMSITCYRNLPSTTESPSYSKTTITEPITTTGSPVTSGMTTGSPPEQENTTTEDRPTPTSSDLVTDSALKSGNTGVVAGSVTGGLAVIVTVLVSVIIICRKRAARRKKGHEKASDTHSNGNNYDMTINTGYVSVEKKENNEDVQRDPRGYALVNKPKPAPKPTPVSGGGSEYAEYNHLNDVLDISTPDNVYNTATGTVKGTDKGDYNDKNCVPHKHSPDNVHNTAGGTMEDVDIGDYNRLNEIKKHTVTDNVYSEAKRQP